MTDEKTETDGSGVSEPEPKGKQRDVLAATGDEYSVEAVAGSGKTTTMVWRLRDEIRERGTPPNRLLVLTFATEASHTIQQKLREELRPEEAFEIDVYNYHSFCYRLLQEYAYYGGLSPEFELITEERRSQLIESIYGEIDFSFVAPGSPAEGGAGTATMAELTTFIERMRRESVEPDEIREYLPSDETIRSLLALTDDLREAAHNQVNVDANGIMWDDDAIANGCESLARVYQFKAREFDGSDSIEGAIRMYLEALSETAESVADHIRSTNDLSWQEYRTPEAVFEDEQSMFDAVEQTPFGRLVAFAHMLRRARAYVSAYEAYTCELDERGALDYDELIHQAVDLLRDEAVRDDILSQWDVVFCDEFQDTDESQLALVEELRDELEIMVIGDSDQAIHEWRGQDPENMSKLPDSFEEIGLDLNFRSRQPILDVTNYLDREKQPIRADREPAPPNVFSVDSEGQETAEQVSTAISHLLTGRFDDLDAVDQGDIAVLVRRNDQARRVAKALDAASIPVSISGNATGELSQGLETVLSYLRLLVTPTDDVSWQRVLLLLYRVPEADVDTLRRHGASIPDGYEAVSDDDLENPAGVARALDDYETLREVSATHSVSELYLHLKRETRIEWFLTEDDRTALGNIDQLVSSFDDSPVQSRLTEDLVAYLERQAHLLTGTAEVATGRGAQSEDAVDVMTIHQAKGLDFDTVLLPFLTEDEFAHLTLDDYQENIYEYDVLVDGIEGEIDDPLRADLREDQIAEEWRVLHVALTRAKERLFMFGNDAAEEGATADWIDRHLPDSESEMPIEWSAEGPRMRIWPALMDSYERIEAENGAAVRDYTDVVNRGVDEDAGNITYYGRDLSTEEAIETLLEAADGFVAGTLADEETGTADADRFADAPLGTESTVELARQHSHTALEALRDCERRHVLDHVVEAFPDPRTGVESDGGRQRDVGTLFHDVAELAYWRGYDTVGAWKDACEWLAASRGLEHAVEPATECIEAFFETPVPEWDTVGAEVPIDFDDVDGVSGAVTGYIDSVRDYPDGGIAILDYKTSREPKSLEESHQLQLYVRACRDRFEQPITHAGYVYVGDAGPATQLFDVADLEPMWDRVADDLRAVDDSSFENYTPGPHCRYCEHRSLGCPVDDYAYDDEYQVGQADD